MAGDREEFSSESETSDEGVRIRDLQQDVVSNVQEIPRSPGISGGVAITGFIDVEKLISVGHWRFFIEKKLPFQIVILGTSRKYFPFERDGPTPSPWYKATWGYHLDRSRKS